MKTFNRDYALSNLKKHLVTQYVIMVMCCTLFMITVGMRGDAEKKFPLMGISLAVFIVYTLLLNAVYHRIKKRMSESGRFVPGRQKILQTVIGIIDMSFILLAVVLIGGHDGLMISVLFLIPIVAGLFSDGFTVRFYSAALCAVYGLSCLADRFIFGKTMEIGAIIFTVLTLLFSIGMAIFINRRINKKMRVLDRQFREYQELGERLAGVRETVTREISQNSKKIENNYIGFLETIIIIMEARDPVAFGSSIQTNNLAIKIAKRLERPDMVDMLRTAGMIHDIGNIGIPDHLFHNEGVLSRDEREQLKSHVSIAEEILSTIDYFKKYIPICKYHHEAYNGSGYPEGLAGDQIPLISRILSVADIYTALTADRYFRHAYPSDEALQIIKSIDSIKFDPAITAALREVVMDER